MRSMTLCVHGLGEFPAALNSTAVVVIPLFSSALLFWKSVVKGAFLYQGAQRNSRTGKGGGVGFVSLSLLLPGEAHSHRVVLGI